MFALCWTVVVLTCSLFSGNTEAVDQNWLTGVVTTIEQRYFMVNTQFSLAANIPVDQNKLAKAFDADDPATVRGKVSGGDVYQGVSVVEATPQYVPEKKITEHAEARVLDHIKPLKDRSEGNILLLYSFLSPCGGKCTNKGHDFNILGKIRDAISTSKWSDRVFVFSKVFDADKKSVIPQTEIQQSLENLGEVVGRDNIFRCYYPYRQGFTCIKCFSNMGVAPECLQNK